jgi:FMN phosphatase YigB (HAD superfamily)
MKKDIQKQTIDLLITDLDDTIWNWFDMWYISFSNYIRNIHDTTKIPMDELKVSFKKLHQKYHSTEFSFAYKELNVIKRKDYKLFESETKDKISIIHQYNHDKKYSLKLYASVHDTLVYLKSRGTKIVGFTETNSFFTKTRIKLLGLDGLIDIVYCPKDIGLPRSVKRFYDKNRWDLLSTKLIEYPIDIKKPNPEILLRIISESNINPNNVLYIGDKLERDILMANSIGITSCYAKYGDSTNDKRYNLLRDVTHWTSVEVNNEIVSHTKTKAVPTYTLDNYGEILKFFDFEAPRKGYSAQDTVNIIEIWKSTVEVQKHFNDLELRIRSLAITIFTFLLGGIGYALKEKIQVEIFCTTHYVSFLVSITGIIILSAFYLMDRFWYHNFLHSSVSQGMEIEKEIQKIYPMVNLTGTIKKESPVSFFKRKLKIHSDLKISIFYFLLLIPFLLLIVGYLCDKI